MFQTFIALLWFIFVGSWLVHSFEAKKTLTSNSKSKRPMLRFALIGSIAFLLFNLKELRPLVEYEFFPDNFIANIIGLILCALGVMMAVHARNYLGQNWGLPMDAKENPDLITTGPYRLIRHPIYTAITLAICGSMLASGFLWFIMLCVLVPYFIYSALKEEKRMLAQFPQQYLAYRKHSKMFIPYLI